MSYKSSEGSTYASKDLSGNPLFGAVGSIDTTFFGVAPTVTEGQVLVYNKVLPKGTWMYTVSAVPFVSAPNELTGARLDVGTGYGITNVFISTSGFKDNTTTSRQVLTSGAYYSDGVTALQAVLTCTTSAGTWSVTYPQDDSQMVVTKVA